MTDGVGARDDATLDEVVAASAALRGRGLGREEYAACMDAYGRIRSAEVRAAARDRATEVLAAALGALAAAVGEGRVA